MRPFNYKSKLLLNHQSDPSFLKNKNKKWGRLITKANFYVIIKTTYLTLMILKKTFKLIVTSINNKSQVFVEHSNDLSLSNKSRKKRSNKKCDRFTTISNYFLIIKTTYLSWIKLEKQERNIKNKKFDCLLKTFNNFLIIKTTFLRKKEKHSNKKCSCLIAKSNYYIIIKTTYLSQIKVQKERTVTCKKLSSK